MSKKSLLVLIIILLILAVTIGVFVVEPLKRVKGGLGGGPIVHGQSAYREEYKCLGLEKDFCPDWPDYGCDYLCYGITYDKQCFIETATKSGSEKTASDCK